MERARPAWLRLPALTTVLLSSVAAGLAAQGVPPALALDVSSDESNGNGDGNWVILQCTAAGPAAGTWYFPVVDAYVAPAYASDYLDQASCLPSFGAPQPGVPFQSFLVSNSLNTTGDSYVGMPPLSVRSLDAKWWYDRTMLANGVPSPDVVDKASDAIRGPSTSLHAQPFREGWSTWDALTRQYWRLDAAGLGYNVDAITQQWTWLKAKESLPGMGRDYFFQASTQWDTLNGYDLDLTVQLLGLRGPSVDPNTVPATGQMPKLAGYPDAKPKFTLSNIQQITFVGTLNHDRLTLSFVPQWATMALPVTPVPSNVSVVTVEASGWRRGMQVRLTSTGGGPISRYTCATNWNDYGVMQVTLPSNIVRGKTYELTEYRYLLPDGSLTAWKLVPAGQRPRFQLQ